MPSVATESAKATIDINRIEAELAEIRRIKAGLPSKEELAEQARILAEEQAELDRLARLAAYRAALPKIKYKLNEKTKIARHPDPDSIPRTESANYNDYLSDRNKTYAPWTYWAYILNGVFNYCDKPLKAFDPNKRYFRLLDRHSKWQIVQPEELKKYLKDCETLEKPWERWAYIYKDKKQPCAQELSWKPHTVFERLDYNNAEVAIVDDVMLSRADFYTEQHQDSLEGAEFPPEAALAQYVTDRKNYHKPWKLWYYLDNKGKHVNPITDMFNKFCNKNYRFFRKNLISVLVPPPVKEDTKFKLTLNFNSEADLKNFEKEMLK